MRCVVEQEAFPDVIVETIVAAGNGRLKLISFFFLARVALACPCTFPPHVLPRFGLEWVAFLF